ncbi:MAG: transposase [Candidatus Paceibacterota bacterium]|jgi:putative transposase
MSLRKTHLVFGEIYHIYNRGVDKRNIFMDDDDRFRFVHDLFEFNDKNPTINLALYLKSKNNKLKEVGLPNITRKPREVLVEILAYCLMDNHFHLMVRQKTENGITEFMRKLGTGYTNYFNKKYERTGALFQGKFKSVNLKKDSHLMYLPIYIHLNPLDYKFKEWREGKINDLEKAIDFLNKYRWSSYLDYVGQKNFPSIIKKDFLLHRLGGEEKQKKEILNWIESFNLKNNENLPQEVILDME